MGCLGGWRCGFSGCGMSRMWDVRNVGCSGSGMFDMWDDRNEECSVCGMFRMWDVLDVRCSGCGMWDVGCLPGCEMLIYKMPFPAWSNSSSDAHFRLCLFTFVHASLHDEKPYIILLLQICESSIAQKFYIYSDYLQKPLTVVVKPCISDNCGGPLGRFVNI